MRLTREKLILAVVGASLVTAAAIGLILTFRPQPSAAVGPHVALLREGSLIVADLSGANPVEVAPASLDPIYGGWAALDSRTTHVYYAVAEGEETVIRRKELEGGSDEIVLKLAIADVTGLRVRPDGKQAIVTLPEGIRLVDLGSKQVSAIRLSGMEREFTDFVVRDWSPDGGLALVWAVGRDGEGGTNLILDPSTGDVLGTVPGLSANWSSDGSSVCGTVAGPADMALARLWVARGPSWEVKEGLSDTMLPAGSCDWLNNGSEVVFATEPWPLDEGQMSQLPTVTAEVYGAEDKTRPEETRVFLGTTEYILPVVGIANVSSGRVRTLYNLNSSLEPGTVVDEVEVREAVWPRIVVSSNAKMAIISTRVQPPVTVDLESGDRVAILNTGDDVVDIVRP